MTTHPLIEMAEQVRKAFTAIENNLIPESHHLELEDTEPDHTWFPNATLDDNGEEYRISVEPRGLDLDEVGIEVKDEMLVLSSVPRQQSAVKIPDRREYEELTDESTVVNETGGYAPYMLEIPLPPNVDAAETIAEFVEDVLEIYLPKAG